VTDTAERKRLWDAAAAVFPNYTEYQGKTSRTIPVSRSMMPGTLTPMPTNTDCGSASRTAVCASPTTASTVACGSWPTGD